MSTKRAITQLVKDYAASSKRLSALEEEKQEHITSITMRYKAREDDLIEKRSASHSALLALGLTAESVETAVKDLAAKPADDK